MFSPSARPRDLGRPAGIENREQWAFSRPAGIRPLGQGSCPVVRPAWPHHASSFALPLAGFFFVSLFFWFLSGSLSVLLDFALLFYYGCCLAYYVDLSSYVLPPSNPVSLTFSPLLVRTRGFVFLSFCPLCSDFPLFPSRPRKRCSFEAAARLCASLSFGVKPFHFLFLSNFSTGWSIRFFLFLCYFFVFVLFVLLFLFVFLFLGPKFCGKSFPHSFVLVRSVSNVHSQFSCNFHEGHLEISLLVFHFFC